MCKNLINDNMNNFLFKDNVVELHPSLKDCNYSEFITKETHIKNASVDISKVIGTKHPDYAGKSWEWCFSNLKREENINLLDCKEKIKYYKDKNYKSDSIDPWSIDIINGKHYTTQGNHRSIIAKFLSYLNMIPIKQFGLTHISYKAYDEKEHARFNRFEKWLKNQKLVPLNLLPEYYVKKQEIKKTGKSSHRYTTIYSTKYYFIKYDNFHPVHCKCDNLYIFRKTIFKIIRNKRKSEFIFITIYNLFKFISKLTSR